MAFRVYAVSISEPGMTGEDAIAMYNRFLGRKDLPGFRAWVKAQNQAIREDPRGIEAAAWREREILGMFLAGDRLDGGGGFPGRGAREPTTTLYRAVDAAEYRQLMQTGRFAQGPNSLGGKFFAENAADAARWGERLQGAGNYRIISATLPTSVANLFMRWQRLDGIGPARYAELEQLTAAIVRSIR